MIFCVPPGDPARLRAGSGRSSPLPARTCTGVSGQHFCSNSSKQAGRISQNPPGSTIRVWNRAFMEIPGKTPRFRPVRKIRERVSGQVSCPDYARSAIQAGLRPCPTPMISSPVGGTSPHSHPRPGNIHPIKNRSGRSFPLRARTCMGASWQKINSNSSKQAGRISQNPPGSTIRVWNRAFVEIPGKTPRFRPVGKIRKK